MPSSDRTILIRVFTHTLHGEKYDEPKWYILGDLEDHLAELWRHNYYNNDNSEFEFGLQKDGGFILDVRTLGLDVDLVLECTKAMERRDALEDEEYRWDLHSDDGPCLCGQIHQQLLVIKRISPVIQEAVNEQFDAWTRRRHLVALGVALGFTSFDMPAWAASISA
jgi:hypothetical protein